MRVHAVASSVGVIPTEEEPRGRGLAVDIVVDDSEEANAEALVVAGLGI